MTRSQATPASSQIIALEGMVQRLEQQLAAAQARIAELREALESVKAQRIDGFMFPAVVDLNAWHTRVINALAKPDDLSALNDLKARYEARIEAIEEVIAENSVPMSDYLAELLESDNRSALEAAKAQARRDALMEAATVCDELESHYSAYKDTAMLNGDVGLSNAASGEPRAARFIAAELRRMAGEVK